MVLEQTGDAEAGLARRSPRGEQGTTGPVKAALWLLSVEEDLAIEILPFLDDTDLALLAATVGSLGRTNPEQLRSIHSEFSRVLSEDNLQLKGSAEYLTKLAEKAFGEDKAKRLFKSDGSEGAGLSSADIDVLSTVIRGEHPQIIAAVLAHLDPEKAAEVLNRLPDITRHDVMFRIAKLSRVPQSALDRAERILSAGLPATDDADNKIDGVKAAARLLNQMEAEAAEDILESMESETDTTANDIRQAMFTFEDLEQLDRRGFQTLLKEVQSDQLMVALKTASDSVREKVFGALSKRAAEMLREDLEVMPPVRLQDVQEAQQTVVSVALRLKSDGRLAISGSGEDFV